MQSKWTNKRRDAVGVQLDALEGSSVFANAPRLMRFLRYLVQAQMDGQGGELNQNRIAIDVMERDDFDPSSDSLVRVEAGRLRSKLRDYYATDGRTDAIRFDLPKGRYSPDVMFASETVGSQGTPTQELRFLKTRDDITLAYSISGDGYPLLKAANWLSHLEFDLLSPVWRHWWAELSRRYRLIRYDERGCGLSDWEVGEFGVEPWVEDLEAVADAVGDEKFALLGISQGAAVAISYAVRHPERVSHLILYGGFAQGRLKRDPKPEQIEEVNLLRELMSVGWGQDRSPFRKVFASFFVPDAKPEQIEAFDALQRASTSPENAVRFFDAFNEIDVVEIASQVRVPTLVLHARHEIEMPVSQGRLLASTIPGARFVPLESGNHILGAEEPAWNQFLDNVDRFIGHGQ